MRFEFPGGTFVEAVAVALKSRVTGLVEQWRSVDGAALVASPYLRTAQYADATYNYYLDAPDGSLLTAAVWHVARVTTATNATVHAFNHVGTSASVLAMVDSDFNGGSIL